MVNPVSPICVETKQQLALFVRRTWLSMHPDVNSDPVNVDEELTNLDWLSNFKLSSLTTPTYEPQESLVYNRLSSQSDDYINEPYTKPNDSFTTLIRRAILASSNQRATLTDIYSWITDNYPYYSQLFNQSWQNSVRHSLSLNKCFQKVSHSPGEPGKGSFWCYVPDTETAFKSKRPSFCDPATPPSKKRYRREEDEAINSIVDKKPYTTEYHSVMDRHPYHTGHRSVLDRQLSIPDHHRIFTGHVKTAPECNVLGYSQDYITNFDIDICGNKLTNDDVLDCKDLFTDSLLDLSHSSDVVTNDDVLEGKDLFKNSLLDLSHSSDVNMGVEENTKDEFSGSFIDMSPPYSESDTMEGNWYQESIMETKDNSAVLSLTDAHDESKSDSFLQSNVLSPYKTSYISHPTESMDLEEVLAFFDR